MNNNYLVSQENTKIEPKKYVLKKQNSDLVFKIDYKKELNESQYEAVTSLTGALLVIAGAGSGKTRTLIYRVARLIESGVVPENILLLTFTRKAAEEMLNRASCVLDNRCEKVAGGTFHSFANLVLRKHASFLELNNTFTIMDRSDAEDVINLIRANIANVKKKRFPRKGTLLDIHSKAINKNAEASEIIKKEYPNFINNTEEILDVCRKYNQYKRKNSLLDYDDLLLYLKMLLISNKNVRSKLSNQYKYIMIDEYQDTNTLQAEIIELLASEHNNVMAVGDDAQSI
ncbi:MAG: UvrD-helicase domain-containing protein, partial [Candidatus Gastranaerophilales bacterium]|nr:UvrD-helicase domain-containing protein [Candidatus Gastranaerophilales bacterium]